ncbi:hypothetical protein AB4427_01365 [Vibrio artabrorum]|uniref:hypothetical protein n=1 Tax=Vibrio artabrorum TaxID=446374 RepID=UPI003552AFAA
MKSNLELAESAVELVLPAIDNMFKQAKRKELHIVVINPTVKPWESDFESAILFQRSLGNPESWAVEFDKLARAKAKQAWKHSFSNIDIQSKHPTLLEEGDVLWSGSFVYGGIVVACSGVEPEFDMLASGLIAVAFEQLAVHEYHNDKLSEPMKTFR